MRSDVVFDTLAFMETLKKSGFPPDQCEAMTKAVTKAFHQLIDFQDISNKRAISVLKDELKSHITFSMWQTVFFMTASLIVVLFFVGVF